MSATSPLGAAGAIGLALLTVIVLQRGTAPAAPRRFATLDGLRGYAAFLVFLQHASAWPLFSRTGIWTLPATPLYIQFGQGSVAIFFMITATLFWTKLLDARTRPINWRRLYTSRVLRLTPLFVFFVALLWLYALALSDFRLRESVPRAMFQTLQWLTFTIAGMPDLNHSLTPIMGGQAWSLPYEWWFYLTLPLAAACLSPRPSMSWVALGLLGAAGAVWWVSRSGSWPVVGTFSGGIAAAYAVRHQGVRAWACSPAATLVCLIALAALTHYYTAFAAAPLLLLSIAFVLIACGNTLFGALSWPAARRLGEIGYSVYLLHGLVLFAGFHWLGERLSPVTGAATHWLVVALCTPIVIAVSMVTFRLVEAPAMASDRSLRRADGAIAEFFATGPKVTCPDSTLVR